MIRRFGELKAHWDLPSENLEWKTLDIKETLIKAFDDIVNVVLFGEEDPEKIPKVDGMTFSRANDHRVDVLFELIRSPLHTLTIGMSSSLHLTKEAKKFFELEASLKSYGYSILTSRLKSEKNREPNLIDILLNDVREEKDPKKIASTFDNIIENMLFLYAAGTDTSRSVSSGMLYFVSKYSELRDALSSDILENLLGGDWKTIQENPTKELDWDKCRVVEDFLKEVLRIEGISDVIFYRICTKEHKIGDIKIKKGTIVNYSPYHLHHSEKYFKNPDELDITRFQSNTT